MKKYFIFKDGQQLGPLTFEELVEMKISRDTLIWFEGLETWSKADIVDELSTFFIKTPPPPPPGPIVSNPIYEETITPEKQQKKKKSIAYKIFIYVSILIIIVCIIVIVFAINKYKYIEGKHDGQQEVIEQVNEKVDDVNKENEAKEKRRKQEVAQNFEKYFILHIRYDKQLFGGLNNIRLTVTNKSKYLIDEMIVNVNIYRSSGNYYKTIQGYLKNVRGHTSMEITLENSLWGSKAEPLINAVTSNEIGLNFSVPYMDLNQN